MESKRELYLTEYNRWLDSPYISEGDKAELKNMTESEIKARFNAGLEFGTAGIRRVMELGPGSINIYTVKHITRAVAEYVLLISDEQKPAPNTSEKTALQTIPKKSVVIAYDCRNNGETYARAAAGVLAAKNIHVFLFESLRPTPELSFAVRYSGSAAGINITASHNTKEYNGYKVYGPDGAQLSPVHADQIAETLMSTDILTEPESADFDAAVRDGSIELIDGYVDGTYLDQVINQSKLSKLPDEYKETAKNLKIVYTPFHGTGYKFVPEILRMDGFENVIPVPEQMAPDGNFPTVKSPNPETVESFQMAIDLASQEGADLIIGTDPDGDRCGIAIRTGTKYRVLTGNQIGVLILDYLIKARNYINGRDNGGNGGADAASANPYAAKSIVSTPMANRICEKHGIEMIEVLTGFKFIGEKMEELSANPDNPNGGREFVFGFEESNGYLTGLYARDKDAILASMLIAETACYHAHNGRSMEKALDALYKEYGYYQEKVISKEFAGADGQEKMQGFMNGLRENPPAELKISKITDYLNDDTGLPKSDVIRYELTESTETASLIIRPSGTEPKIKFYLSTSSDSNEEAGLNLSQLESAVHAMLA